MKEYIKLCRLNHPIGFLLLFLPSSFGIGLANGAEYLKLYIIFFIGSVLMRSSGCIINDLADYKFDQLVERTKTRPLASGKITKTNAIIFLCVLLALSLLLLLQLNNLSIILGLASIIPVIIYPFMKRITYWPQLFLGITFNWGAFMGYAASTGALNLSCFILYLGCIFWTLGYDTIYAHQDKDDDALIGVKSTALRLGDQTKAWIFAFYAIFIMSLMLVGYMNNLAPLYFTLIAISAIHLFWQVQNLDINKKPSCNYMFKSNWLAGSIVFLAFLMSRVN